MFTGVERLVPLRGIQNSLITDGDGSVFFVLPAKIIDSSLGNAKQITVFTRVNSIPSIKLIDFPLINEQFLILFLNIAAKYVIVTTFTILNLLCFI